MGVTYDIINKCKRHTVVINEPLTGQCKYHSIEFTDVEAFSRTGLFGHMLQLKIIPFLIFDVASANTYYHPSGWIFEFKHTHWHIQCLYKYTFVLAD